MTTTYFTTFKIQGDAGSVYQYLLDSVRKFWPDAVGLCRRSSGDTDVITAGERVRGCQVFEIYQSEDGYLLKDLLKGAAAVIIARATDTSVELRAEAAEAIVVLQRLQKHPLWR